MTLIHLSPYKIKILLIYNPSVVPPKNFAKIQREILHLAQRAAFQTVASQSLVVHEMSPL